MLPRQSPARASRVTGRSQSHGAGRSSACAQHSSGAGRVSPSPTIPRRTPAPMSNAPAMPPAPVAPTAQPARPPPQPQYPRDQESLPTLDIFLRHIRQEVARALTGPPEARVRDEQHIQSLAVRPSSRPPRPHPSPLALAPGARALALPLPGQDRPAPAPQANRRL